ncbi:uncharacterized protein MELLADRAFT_85120 [Melampsora larici-populina 98AG31]|uniref:Uncharacterized protein n=1 Tax=Melampsora larici-populina (strain 98AG31 / pathotype 3-4-7) TaxID=747676 RepID=F4SCX9_MELLP|nr:uncharacterized protein MELLADRAFT_85120 [Melampsora larici-populina 98AG31]EGF97499.1 hypothetical protein MELLADRAFT_85120 [Melampsora larici-populina 98AG31]
MSSIMQTLTPTCLQPPPNDLLAPTRGELHILLTQHAEANGYKLATRSSEDTSVRYTCHRSGPKPSENSASQKTNCPFSFTAYQITESKVPTALHQLVNPSYIPPRVGCWTVRIKHPGHNHGPIGSETQETKCPVAESLTVIKQRSTVMLKCYSKAFAEIQDILNKYHTNTPDASTSSHQYQSKANISPLNLPSNMISFQPSPPHPNSPPNRATESPILKPSEPFIMKSAPISTTLSSISNPKRKRKIKKAPKAPEPLPTASTSPPTVLHNAVPEPPPPVQVPNLLMDVVNISRQPPATPSYALKASDSAQPNSAICLRLNPLVDYDSEALPTPAPPSPANPATSVDSPLPSPTTIIPAIITTLSPRECSGPTAPISPTDNNGDDSFDIISLLPLTSPSKHPEESCSTVNTIQTEQLTCTNVRTATLTQRDH